MRRNDIKALHEKSITELQAQVVELIKQFAGARLEKKAGRRKNTHIALLADDIARVKTVLKKKELASK